MIKKIYIKKFKSLNNFNMELNPNINIIIGQNEAGKSTILEAMNLAINCRTNSDTNQLYQYLNYEDIENFKSNPSVVNLPKCEIEVYYGEEKNQHLPEVLCGYANEKSELAYGIKCTLKVNEEYIRDLEDIIGSGIIPIEYYLLEFLGFSGRRLSSYVKYPKFELIDNTVKINGYKSFYNKLFRTLKLNDDVKQKMNEFKSNIQLTEYEISMDIENMELKIDEGKIDLLEFSSIYENGAKLENKGSGRENIAKANLLIDSMGDNKFIIGIEEPENHLSYMNLRKFIKDIQDKLIDKQIIITTHNNLITSSLGLKNVKFINKGLPIGIDKLSSETEKYFKKLDKNNIHDFVLAEKNILVEGRAEYILLQNESFVNINFDQERINVISCDGIQYNRYLEVAETLSKKTLVITDNDGKEERLNEIGSSESGISYIAMDSVQENYTFEVSLYQCNEELLKEKIDYEQSAVYNVDKKINGETVDYSDKPVLRKMLQNQNKAETAFILSEEANITCPQYIKEGIEWLIKD